MKEAAERKKRRGLETEKQIGEDGIKQERQREWSRHRERERERKRVADRRRS